MDFSLPVSVGITNEHWVKFFVAHVSWLHSNKIIGDAAFEDARQKLRNLSDKSPEPSFDNFRNKIVGVLPLSVVAEFFKIPVKYAFYTANTLVIKDNNDVMFTKYFEYRDNLRDIASSNLSLFQILNDEVTTVGYQLALFYNSFKTILENMKLSRKYAEFINSSVSLVSFVDSYDPDKLDFIAREVGLFNVTSFSSLNLNSFIASMRDVGIFVKAVIGYIKVMADKGLLEADNSLFAKVIDWANLLLADEIPVFEVNFSLYSRLFIYMDNALSNMHKVITTMKLNLEAFEKESTSIDKKKYLSIIVDLSRRIFNEQ